MERKNVLIIAVALILSAFILGSFFYNARKNVNTIRVVGYAAGEYDSDILKWRLNFSAIADSDNLIQGYTTLNSSIEKFRHFLIENNLDPRDLLITPAYNYANYNRDGIVSNYTFEQSVTYTVRDTVKFNIVENFVYDLSVLAEKGINVRFSSIEYFLSALPELKKEIIANATRDARERALEVANTTNTKLGKLINGRVGVFQITEPLSTEVESYGIYNTSTRRKQISVTMNGVFELK